MAIKKLKWLSPQIYPIGRNNQKKKSKNFIIGLENRIFIHMHPKSRRVSRSGIIGAGAGKKKKPHWKPAYFYNGPNPEPASREERERVPHSATAQDPETIRTQFSRPFSMRCGEQAARLSRFKRVRQDSKPAQDCRIRGLQEQPLMNL